MARVPVHGGRGAVVAWAIIDDADLARVSEWRWRLDSKGYVRAQRYVGGGRSAPRHEWASIARLIMGVTDRAVQVDHKDRDKLNNRRANLRLVTNAQNSQNRLRRGRNRFRGVQRLPSGRWQAQAQHGGRNRHVGTFDTELEAAIAVHEYRKEHLPFAEPDPALEAHLAARHL